MNNSYPNKLAKLIGHFLQSPGILFPYIKHLPAWKKSPSDYETPWLSFPSIYFLETYIRPWHKVFEYGGGGSTFWFARRAQYVLSVESEKTWHDHISTKLTKKGLKNSSCEFHPISGDHPNDFREDSFFRRIEGQAWDIVLVDCY